jgi:hypothetical protein
MSRLLVRASSSVAEAARRSSCSMLVRPAPMASMACAAAAAPVPAPTAARRMLHVSAVRRIIVREGELNEKQQFQVVPKLLGQSSRQQQQPTSAENDGHARRHARAAGNGVHMEGETHVPRDQPPVADAARPPLLTSPCVWFWLLPVAAFGDREIVDARVRTWTRQQR